MSELPSLFLNNLLPILLAAAAGYPLGKWLHVNPRPLSQVIFYIFSPCLVFKLLTDNPLEISEILRMMLFASLIMVMVGSITLAAGMAMKFERRLLAAVLLTSIFMNAGNYGMPLNLFAFGENALAYAGLYFVTMAVMTNIVGVVIASMGRSSFTQSIVGLVKLPTIYALILGVVFVRMGWELPLPVDRTVTLLKDASIPSMLVLLGLQFQQASWKGHTRALALSNSMRLMVAPGLALGLSLLFGFQGPARQASVLESGMPTAVLTTILATEYDVEPSFVTSAVFASTLLSPLTLTPLLAFLSG
ncbi:MAG: AEC family transporter [Chloroflexota bacterium]|nr:MAG: AEC family transporter [Chloroflexota bacterium]